MLLIRSALRPVRILCARETQNSIQDSVHQLLVDQIEAMGMLPIFNIKENKITAYNGSEFLFKGLRGIKNNAQSIKSLEGVDLCWIEEGSTISAESFQTLTPTIRKQNAEIWITMNPDQVTDPVYQLILNPPSNAAIRKVNWSDNPWFKDTSLPSEREWMERTDPDAYRHVWEGECRQNSDSQVLKNKFTTQAFTVTPDFDGPYQGVDWGFSTDPTAFVRCWIYDRCLYVEHESYGIGIEIDQLPVYFDNIPGARDYTTRADNARPETISYLQRHGYQRLIAADKWPGSVEDGVAYLRSFDRIIIHPRCKHTAEEARLWSYKTDRLTGDILPQLMPRNDHTWDAIRYALAPLIRMKDPGMTAIKVSGL